jgi:hypothetical protein
MGATGRQRKNFHVILMIEVADMGRYNDDTKNVASNFVLVYRGSHKVLNLLELPLSFKSAGAQERTRTSTAFTTGT